MRQYIDPDPSRPTPKRRRENKRPETISKGISRIKYVKKNELTEYALSVCSYRGFSKRGYNGYCSTVPCKRYPVPMGIG